MGPPPEALTHKAVHTDSSLQLTTATLASRFEWPSPNLIGMAIGNFGDASIGSQLAVMIDLLDYMSNDELSQFVAIAELCSFGPAMGLALAVVATSLSPLRQQNNCGC